MSGEKIVDPWWEEECKKHPERHHQDLCEQLQVQKKKISVLERRLDEEKMKLYDLIATCEHKEEKKTEPDNLGSLIEYTTCSVCGSFLRAKPVDDD